MFKYKWLGLLILCLALVACSNEEAQSSGSDDDISAGLLVTESGLGDDSFSDSAFQGLEQARNELGITFDYREPFDGDFEGHMEDLIDQGHNVIIGLGYASQGSINALAEVYPDQHFVLIDAVSEFDNVTSITFKEDEGSYLIGLLAGMKTESDVVGFVGGEKIEVVERFEKGFRDGVLEVNSEADVLAEYADTFNDDTKGEDLTLEMVEEGADYIFHAAGFTGVGVMKEAERQGVYAFGADSDQYYVAEDAVVSSMMKNVDVALYDVMSQLVQGETLEGGLKELGIAEEGVGLAPIRLINLSDEEQDRINEEVGQ